LLAVPRVRSHRQRAFDPALRICRQGLWAFGIGRICAPRDAERRCRRASAQSVAILRSLESTAPVSKES
jgi:hypothetical protein